MTGKESILNKYRAGKEVVRLQMDPEVKAEIGRLEAAINKEEIRSAFREVSMADVSITTIELKEELEAVREKSSETLFVFTFSGMPASKWKAFTEKTKDDSEDGIPTDESLAHVMAVSLESVSYGDGDPESLTEGECLSILTDWTDGDATALIQAALASNNKSSSVPFG